MQMSMVQYVNEYPNEYPNEYEYANVVMFQ